MEIKLIDVSKHNGAIDWSKVKAAGIEGVLIRAGYGKYITQKDVCFEKNYAGAKAAGLFVGTYWYTYAVTEAEAEAEAETYLEVIKGKSFDLPVYLDIEDKNQTQLDKALVTKIATAFCNKLEQAGYYCGVYSFDSFFTSFLDETIPERFTIWAARVEKVKPTCAKTYDIWQYSWKGKINGINGDVDLNICYKDFPTIIKESCLNNCKPGEDSAKPGKPETSQPAEEEIEKYKINAYKLGLTKDEADALTRILKTLGMPVTVDQME
jgi:GH25 family lysozyme M1 (1,4-beta-N-acetylmuramidase)